MGMLANSFRDVLGVEEFRLDKSIDIEDDCVEIHVGDGYLGFDRDFDIFATGTVPALADTAGEQKVMETKKGEYELEDFGYVQRL